MPTRIVCAALALLALASGQESRPTAAPATRPAPSIYVVGAVLDDDILYRIDGSTLRITESFPVEGGCSYGRLTPDGGQLIVATRLGNERLRGTRGKMGGAVFGLVPRTLAPSWAADASSIIFGNMRSEPLAIDPTVPDGAGLLEVGWNETESRPAPADGRSVRILGKQGVTARVRVPDKTTYFALRGANGRTSVIAVDSENKLWHVEGSTGLTRLVADDRKLLLSGQPRALAVAQSENRAVCFGGSAECAVVDLDSGTVAHRVLPALLERGVSFARRCERTGHYLVCSAEHVSWAGSRLFLLDSDFREIVGLQLHDDDRFVDAMFSEDGKQFLALTDFGWLRLYDVGPSGDATPSPESLPLRRSDTTNRASIAGWR